MAGTGTQALQQQILQQLQRVIETSQRPRVVGGNQTTMTATQCGSSSQVLQVLSTATARSPPTKAYAYRVRIINPAKRSDVVIRQLNKFSSRFSSVDDLRKKLREEFQDQVSSTADFNVGYCEGSQQARVWLVTPDDLNSMYVRYDKGGAVTLWCDGKSSESTEEDHRGKRKRESGVGRYQEKEEKVESVFKELQEKHGKKYDTPRLRLWSRMICSGIHEDYNTPPDIPAFSGVTPKKPRKDSLSDALTGAAVAFAQSLSGSKTRDDSPNRMSCSTSLPTATGISPGKAIELRMKNLEQLRYLQQLFEDGVLSEAEFTELKRGVLSSLRTL